MSDETDDDVRRATGPTLAAVGVVCTSSLVLVSVLHLGTPLKLFTWLAVLLAAGSGATLALTGRRRLWFPACLSACFYLAFPGPCQVIPMLEKWSLFDDRGGRHGWAITPGLMFGVDGPNTELMEGLVGPLAPNWWVQAPLSPYIRDGNERVNSRSVIRYSFFPDVLQMLPDDKARRAVIEALTDTENRLRVHQGLLLTCLVVESYPDGMDAESWWSHHKLVLRPEYDAAKAASITFEWSSRVQAHDALANDARVAS